MTNTTLAWLSLGLWLGCMLLAVADNQPKPRWTTAYTLRCIIGFTLLGLLAVAFFRAV